MKKGKYYGIIVAMSHKQYTGLSLDYFRKLSKDEMILFDWKGLYRHAFGESLRSEFLYWTL